MTFISGKTPPTSQQCVLVYFVFDPHYIPEWGYDLAFYEDGKWKLWWDHEELDYEVILWAIVDKPPTNPANYWQ